MKRSNIHARTAGLAVCSAMGFALLGGCSGHASVASAGAPVVSGQVAGAQADAGLAKAEARVAKSPRDAAARSALAQAYLAAGRFDSAATTYEDAIGLGDQNARNGLGLALAYAGTGRNGEALAVLNRWRAQIPASDLGLAVALAGQPAQGVALLSDALRSGDNTPKTRQNLAYAYALDGRWSEARIVASQDVPADQIDARMGEWAGKARADQYQTRIAGMLGAPVTVDGGQPAALALNDVDHAPRMASAAAPASAELAPVASNPAGWGMAAAQDDGSAVQGSDQASVEMAAADPAPLATNSPEAVRTGSSAYVAQPRVKAVASERSVLADSVEAAAEASHGPKFIQLGSFRTLEGAKRAWGIFIQRDPSLKNHAMRITEAEVHGRRYYRVAAEGFDDGGARSTCSSATRPGDGCFAYAGSRTLPGALPAKVQTGAMLAMN